MMMMNIWSKIFSESSWFFMNLSMWKKKNCSFWWKKLKSTNRSKIAFIIWWLSFNLNESSHMTCHLISQSINIMKVPSKLKVLISDICMSENRCLEIRFGAFSFLLFWAIRQVKWQRFLTWEFSPESQSHENSWWNFNHHQRQKFPSCKFWRNDFIKISISWNIMRHEKFQSHDASGEMVCQMGIIIINLKRNGMRMKMMMNFQGKKKGRFYICLLTEIYPSSIDYFEESDIYEKED